MPTDKHGNPITTGDIVDVVYGGDHHSGEIEKIEALGSVDLLTVRVKAVVPAAAARLNHEKTAATRATREETKKHTTHHRAATKSTDQRPATSDQRPPTNDHRPMTTDQEYP